MNFNRPSLEERKILMAGKFELKKATNGQFYFNLKAGNGEIILSSELYEARAGAENGIESVRKNASLDERYELKTSAKGDPYFVLKAGNGQVIGKSEMYSSESAAKNGIDSVQRNASDARVEDLTDK
jgi:hypothetical protein